MMTGPLATPDQIEIETLAARLRDDPELQAAMRRVGEEWLARMPADPANRARFDRQFEAAVFCGHMFAANDDPLYPRIHAFGRIEHETDGQRIPTTKSAHPNIDYVYRFAPVDGTSRYLLRGRMPAEGPVAIEYSLLTAAQGYQHNISLPQLVVEPDGSFEISVDPDAAGDRPNHFQTTGDSVQLLLRDVIADPARQRPTELAITRLGQPPARPRQSLAEMRGNVERQVRKHIEDLDYTTVEFCLKRPVNSFAPPIVSTAGILSVAQAYSPGHYRIAADEALVVTMTLGGAAYAVVPVTDLWGGVGDLLAHQTALGTGQAVPNPDGSYTFVVALGDPGVANWVDPGGLSHGIIFLRWIGLDPAAPRPPELSVRLVALADLDEALPPATPRTTPAERAEARARRRTAYAALLG